MKTPHRLTVRLASLLVMLAAVLSPGSVTGAQSVTNWVAFNDHRPGPLPKTNAWGTALGVSVYDMRVGPGGPLTNFLNQQELPVTLSVTATGSPDDFGQTGPPYPILPGSPAHNLFFGIVDVGNTNSVIGVRLSANSFVTLTFSGLDPAKHYVFRGTSARGGSYPLRWSVSTILGADTYIDSHLDGIGSDPNRIVLTSNTYPAVLDPGQAAYNSGDNRPGAVVGWDFISPGADGTFSIQSSNYVGPIPSGGNAGNNVYGYAISAMLLAEVEVSAPVITTQPPALTSVEQNRPFSLSVAATGTPLLYQWHKQGAGPIAGATAPTYSVSQAGLADTGDYFVVVYNPLDSKTSTVAHVTVNADVTPPSVATAFSYPSFDRVTQASTLNQVVVEFNEAIQSGTVINPASYLISGGVGNPASVILTNDRSVVLNLAAPLPEDTAFTVQVTGALDLVGNNISGGTNNPAPFRTWMQGPANSLLFEAYDTGAGVTVDLLTSSAVFPNSPFFRAALWAFDSRVAFPDDTHEAYGSRVSGVFIPPVSGDWVFYLRSDNRSELYLNPNGLDPAGKQIVVAEVTGENGDWNKLISSAYKLRGGQGYYIEGLQKEDTGIDFIKVAARLAGTGLPTLGVPNTEVDSNSLMGASIAFQLAPRDLGGALTIAQDLPNLTAEENNLTTLSIQLNNPSKLPLQYQWFRGGAEITGAIGPTYTIQPTIAADNGATFSVRVAKVGSVVTSRTATLNVVPDVTRPRVLGASNSYLTPTLVTVRFNELVLPNDAQDPILYEVSDNALVAATLQPDGSTIVLEVVTPLTPGASYQLTVTDVPDLAGLQINPNPTILTFIGGSDLPRLAIVRYDTYVDISWQVTAGTFTLEEANEFLTPESSTVWAAVSTAPVVVNGRNLVSLTIDSGKKFFRLRQ